MLSEGEMQKHSLFHSILSPTSPKYQTFSYVWNTLLKLFHVNGYTNCAYIESTLFSS